MTVDGLRPSQRSTTGPSPKGTPGATVPEPLTPVTSCSRYSAKGIGQSSSRQAKTAIVIAFACSCVPVSSATASLPSGADDLQDVAGVYHHVLLAERDACPAAECFGRLPALPFDRGQLRLSGFRAPFQLPDAHMLADDLHAVLAGTLQGRQPSLVPVLRAGPLRLDQAADLSKRGPGPGRSGRVSPGPLGIGRGGTVGSLSESGLRWRRGRRSRPGVRLLAAKYPQRLACGSDDPGVIVGERGGQIQAAPDCGEGLSNDPGGCELVGGHDQGLGCGLAGRVEYVGLDREVCDQSRRLERQRYDLIAGADDAAIDALVDPAVIVHADPAVAAFPLAIVVRVAVAADDLALAQERRELRERGRVRRDRAAVVGRVVAVRVPLVRLHDDPLRSPPGDTGDGRGFRLLCAHCST